MDILGKDAAKICELINGSDFLAFHCNKRLNIWLAWCWLVHDFGLLGAYCEAEVVTCSGRTCLCCLHLQLRACIEWAVISKENVPQHSVIVFGESMKSAQV